MNVLLILTCREQLHMGTLRCSVPIHAGPAYNT